MKQRVQEISTVNYHRNSWDEHGWRTYDIDTIGERNTGGGKSAVMKTLVKIKSGVMIVI